MNVVFSFRRSGNHWLRAMIHDNFNARCKKNHLFAKPNLLKNFTRTLYLVRDGRDCLVSNYFWWMKSGESNAWGLRDLWEAQQPTFEQFIMGDVAGWYDATQAPGVHRGEHEMLDFFKNPARSWADHVMSFAKTDISLVRYEDLHENFEDTMAYIQEEWGLNKVLHKYEKKTDLTGLMPRRGKVGDWKNYFTEKAEAQFWLEASEAMRAAGYKVDKIKNMHKKLGLPKEEKDSNK